MLIRNIQTNLFKFFLKSLFIAILLIVGITFFKPIQKVPAAPTQVFNLYLPQIANADEKNILLGLYPSTYWQPNGIDGALEAEFASIDNWSGKKVSLAGVFHFIEQHDDYIVDDMFTAIWNSGYTPFVNIHFSASASSIANGAKDADIHAWAQQFNIYANGGTRMAFLAPMQEMNGDWVPYGSSNPANYKAAFLRIQQIFNAEGVPSSSVKWVFAPNGWSSDGWPGFEAYYPGDSIVDIVGFSSYNYGYHPQNQFKDWETPDEILSPFIDRMNVMAPLKPIFVAQTGTTAYGPTGFDVSLKNQWLNDFYALLTNQDVAAVIYYNANNQFDWAFYRYDVSSIRFDGYIQGISNKEYQYISPANIRDLFP